jgi:hypothetical protein
MISHFNLSDSDLSFYFEISGILQETSGLKVTGIVGDGSAETWFEARIGEQLQVCVLPIWDAGSDSLCQRYDQNLIEQGIRSALEDVRFCSERLFNRDICCWQQKIVAQAQEINSPTGSVRNERPHQHVCESGVVWQRQSAM